MKKWWFLHFPINGTKFPGKKADCRSGERKMKCVPETVYCTRKQETEGWGWGMRLKGFPGPKATKI